jgi:hypothetical protein
MGYAGNYMLAGVVLHTAKPLLIVQCAVIALPGVQRAVAIVEDFAL